MDNPPPPSQGLLAYPPRLTKLDVRLCRLAFEAVWKRDLTSEGMEWTPGLAMFGYRPAEVVSHSSWWRERVHPNDLAPTLRRIEAAIAGDASEWVNEYRFRRRDESWADVVARGVIDRDVRGRAVQTAGVIMDVTRLQERSQDLLELVLETLPVGVTVTDRVGNVVRSNHAARRIWGNVIDSGEERYEKSVGFWHRSGRRIETAEWGSQRALHEGETRLNELIDIDAFDGERRTISNSAAPIRDEHQQNVGAVVVMEDVTERVRQEEELGRHERQQRALAQLSLSALNGDDVRALFVEATTLVAHALGVDYGVVLEWLPAEQRMEFRAGAGPWVSDIVARVTVPTAPGFMAWFYVRAQAPLVVEDVLTETRFAPCGLLVAHGVRSAIAVPIVGKERPFGVLEANSKVLRRFSEDEVHFVWAVANVLATSIERARAVSELREKREELRTLSRKLIEAQEAERRAVARELHDDFGQVLTALRLNLQRQPPNEEENLALVDGAIARMRDLAQDLRPPQLDELGLESSLRWYVEREAARAGLEVELSLDPLPTTPAIAVATTCFRVAQEALTNVIRHAQARRVSIGLRPVGGQFELVVNDDGVGFDVAEARRRAARGESQGLLGMQERLELVGGELEVDSALGRGSRVRARLPLGAANERDGPNVGALGPENERTVLSWGSDRMVEENSSLLEEKE